MMKKVKINFIEAAMKYRQVTIVLTLLLMILGIYSLATMARSEDPLITVRKGLVIAAYPGADELQVEQQLTNHGAKGGDWFGTTNFGENYGWKILGWGGTNYSGTKIGPKWKPGFTKAIKYWVPSIAVSAMTIYKGNTFKEWNGDALVTSLKDQSLRKIRFKNNIFMNEEIIFKGNIGRIRDIKIQEETGDLYMLSDNGSLWRIFK